MITDVEGVLVGHWTDPGARTGCTVVLFPDGTVASGEVRGGAPATREFELLGPDRMVQRIDALVLSGGSAFGLAAADGVVRWLEEQGRGLPVMGGVVPIVVALCLFDLLVGDGSVRPGPLQGRAAAASARGGARPTGVVGAGTGATVAKWRGRQLGHAGGLGTATVRDGELVVSALMAVNAFGQIDRGDLPAWPVPAEVPFAPPGQDGDAGAGAAAPADVEAAAAHQNTTIGLVVTNAKLDKLACLRLARAGQDGLARALVPAHAAYDGDAIVAAATGAVEAPVEQVRHYATQAAERAVRAVAS